MVILETIKKISSFFQFCQFIPVFLQNNSAIHFNRENMTSF